MPRPFLEKLKDSTWWLEQAAHGWIGAGAALPSSSLVYGLSGDAGAAFGAGIGAALAVAIIREVVQNVGDSGNDVLDSIADAFFTTLGGTLTSTPWCIVLLTSA